MRKECDKIGIRAWFLMCAIRVDNVVGFFAFFQAHRLLFSIPDFLALDLKFGGLRVRREDRVSIMATRTER
jgi:hypothetical protein